MPTLSNDSNGNKQKAFPVAYGPASPSSEPYYSTEVENNVLHGVFCTVVAVICAVPGLYRLALGILQIVGSEGLGKYSLTVPRFAALKANALPTIAIAAKAVKNNLPFFIIEMLF